MFTKIFQFITEINEGDVEITTASCEKKILTTLMAIISQVNWQTIIWHCESDNLTINDKYE